MAKSINPNLKLKPKTSRSLEQLLSGLTSGDRFVLSEVLTLVESNNTAQRDLGEQVLNRIDLSSKKTFRVGITGSPGAGKSTFIEKLGIHYVEQGKKVAVLAIDPSSTKSQGSILGDKTRMQTLSVHKNAFVRPTASANRLGGVAQATKESIALCEAAGYDIILIESVGVGQSETELADLVDMYLLLLLPGGGDGVQGIKRGVVELADMMVVNKYDGESKLLARQSQKDFAMTSTLFHHELEDWKVPVALCSSIEDVGFDKIMERINSFRSLSEKHSFYHKKRNAQDRQWVTLQIKKLLIHKANQLFSIDDHLKNITEYGSVFKLLQRVSTEVDSDFKTFMHLKDKIEKE